MSMIILTTTEVRDRYVLKEALKASDGMVGVRHYKEPVYYVVSPEKLKSLLKNRKTKART